MRMAVGLPDLHPGKGSPIGAAFAVEGFVYPHLVGNDIGCGIGLWQTSLSAAKVRRDKWAEKLRGIDGQWHGGTASWLQERGIAESGYEKSLGTIGGGNHFAELQTIEQVTDETAFTTAGFSRDQVYLLVHSGSRGFGEAILRAHTGLRGAGGLEQDSAEAAGYMQRHDHAMHWAQANRELVARRVLECLGAEGRRKLDVCHNYVDRVDIGGRPCRLHRKGAAPSTAGLLVIPGSRGAFSYLASPVASEKSAYSLAHGAGRKWTRADAKGRLEKRFTAKQLVRTELRSLVICEDDALLFEEAPQCYKNVTVVIDDLVLHGLVSVVAILRPVITYKVRRQRYDRD